MATLKSNKSILHIKQSLKDKMTQAELSKNENIQTGDQPKTYRDCVVLKPWGHEFLIFKNKHVAVWLLHIKKNHSTSMHCHSLKSTSLILLGGKALSNTFMSRTFLESGDAVAFDKGVFHSTKALALDDIFVLEIESPPNKVDLLRLRDNYGRENYCYECVNQMVRADLSSYGHFYMEDADIGKEYVAVNNKSSIILHKTQDSGKDFKIRPSSLYSLCEGGGGGKISMGGLVYGRELVKNPLKKQSLLMEIRFS